MDRPECNPVPPDIAQTVEVLKYLLQVEMKRLETAMRIEGERNIVFPETTVIIRDIQKLMRAINPGDTDEVAGSMPGLDGMQW